MTAQINRRAAFVSKDGALTQYGWAVMQDLWTATGGAVSISITEMKTIEVNPISALRGKIGDVSPVGVSQAVGGDVGPVPVLGDAMEWG